MYYTWDDLFWLFVIYSFLGWCAGVIANALRRKRFINTGFFNLPLCPIYGFIGIGYSIFLPELKHRFFFLFLGGAVVALLVIVVTGALLEHVFNRKWWDYMADIMETNPDNSPVSIDLKNVFHLD